MFALDRLHQLKLQATETIPHRSSLGAMSVLIRDMEGAPQKDSSLRRIGCIFAANGAGNTCLCGE
jgi:hypothetical protein